MRDSLARIDSLERARLKADSVKAPFARAELPHDREIGRQLHWNRDSLFATGAITVADLLERVPGISTLRAGWIAAPSVGAYLGDVRRVRVFIDGFELTPLDPRSGGAIDLTRINLWSAEEAYVEQGPEEVRVHLRSWRVSHTIPDTRTDISTGDQQTNLYRGFFGRRFHNGVGIQFGAQQFGTSPPSSFGTSNDQLGLVGRIGWARNNWSVDGFMTRVGGHRGVNFGDALGDSIPPLDATRSDSYVRVGYGDSDTSRVWAQVMAVASKYDYTGVRTVPTVNLKTAAESALAVTSLDTSVSRPQYVAMVGSVRGALRVSGGVRMFGSSGKSFVSPTARASFSTRLFNVSAFAEGKGLDSVARADVSGQFMPLSFVALLGGIGRTSEQRPGADDFSATYMRAQAGLRVHNLWLLGGAIRRDSVRLSPPHVFDTAFVARSELAVTGTTAGVRGQLWRLVNLDLSAVRWNDIGIYRPQYQTRSELFVRTKMLDRFPSGNLGIMASIVHEYRSPMQFPTQTGVTRLSSGYRTLSTLLEIRILSATVSWQFRNFLGERYSLVPSFIMPRQTNFYGVRWDFFD
jgi:hypothetical protein